jgi:hypothetical protein
VAAVLSGPSWTPTPLSKLKKINYILWEYTSNLGRAIAQAVSRGLRAPVRSCGICGVQRGTRAGFLRVLGFPLPILTPSTASYSSSGAGTVGQFVAAVPSGLSLIPPHETGKKLHLISSLFYVGVTLFYVCNERT